MDEEEFEEEYEIEIAPQRFSKHVVIGAALDFLDHVHEGFGCMIARLNYAWVAHQTYEIQRCAFEEAVRADLESIPEAIGGESET